MREGRLVPRLNSFVPCSGLLSGVRLLETDVSGLSAPSSWVKMFLDVGSISSLTSRRIITQKTDKFKKKEHCTGSKNSALKK